MIIYGDTYETNTPEQLITQANGGKPIAVRDIRILQAPRSDKGTAWSLKFTAVVRPLDLNHTLESGEVILSTDPFVLRSETGFLVEPFKVDRETIGLSKTADGTYVFQIHKGYRFESRLDLNQTINGHDISDVVSTALLDSGIFVNNARTTHNKENSTMTVQLLQADIPAYNQTRFEQQLIRRVSELKDFISARRSRLSSVADDVEVKTAFGAENSGFASDQEAYKALGIQIVDGRSTYFDGSPWHANHPLLVKQGDLYYLSVDDRIYSEGMSLQEGGFKAVLQARQKRMTPIRVSGGASYLVYFIAQRAVLWSGYYEGYALFSDLVRAQEFIRTHRFVKDNSGRF